MSALNFPAILLLFSESRDGRQWHPVTDLTTDTGLDDYDLPAIRREVVGHLGS